MFVESDKRGFGKGMLSTKETLNLEKEKQWVLLVAHIKDTRYREPRKVVYLSPFGCKGNENFIDLCNLISEPLEKVREIFVEAFISCNPQVLKVGKEEDMKNLVLKTKGLVCVCMFKLEICSL